ncbi:tRNA (cytidine(34)-2'-O)-methyltransferase [Thiorhodovibrio winogradskyi]|uniref:tRNA (cytidine(34)-2'-O)-methyltransferase n=1 Tax=Thiorhodovibrio winogradskyi TaxID=77007 RepID=UPI002E2AC156|nr:tRNA (cytidine(34)-2'-O)-methyltransferase [Thiorhodovibrio winogradskyi]
MLDILLYEPEIPPNTGNIMRLCANVGARLHLIKPLGFTLEDRLMRRAGLDYPDWSRVTTHDSLAACLDAVRPPRLFALSTRGGRCYAEVDFRAGDSLLFGPETRGLPDEVLAALSADRRLRIPMRPGNRSLNLSNAVALVAYEVWRQSGFAGEDG